MFNVPRPLKSGNSSWRRNKEAVNWAVCDSDKTVTALVVKEEHDAKQVNDNHAVVMPRTTLIVFIEFLFGCGDFFFNRPSVVFGFF